MLLPIEQPVTAIEAGLWHNLYRWLFNLKMPVCQALLVPFLREEARAQSHASFLRQFPGFFKVHAFAGWVF